MQGIQIIQEIRNMKVVFLFAGTGDDGKHYSRSKENSIYFGEDVVRIYLQGCQHEKVGGGLAFPDLTIAANNIRTAFDGEKKTLNLKTLREHFGSGIHRIEGDIDGDEEVDVEQIGLCGFSRGAVTTFAAAKALNDLDIPMDIVANQPVPGDIVSSSTSNSIYKKFSDLRKCHNIRSATTLIGSYSNEEGLLHNHLFYQMLAKYPQTTQVNNRLVPYKAHLDWFVHYHLNAYMGLKLMERGYANELAGYLNGKPLTYQSLIEDFYTEDEGWVFTPYEFSQFVYGNDGSIERDEFYVEVQCRKALATLQKHSDWLEMPKSVTPEQAYAINLVSTSGLSDEIGCYDLILHNPKTSQFCQIASKIEDACRYFELQTRDKKSDKSQLIRENSLNYQRAVLEASYNYLVLPNPGRGEKLEYLKAIKQASQVFTTNALGQDRGYARSIMMLLTNFITHITGTFLIFNTINKATTGNWLLFSQTSSEQRLRTVNDSIVQTSVSKRP